MPSSPTALRILVEARKELAARQWCQDGYYFDVNGLAIDPDGISPVEVPADCPVCAAGALRIAAERLGCSTKAFNGVGGLSWGSERGPLVVARRFLQAHIPGHFTHLEAFNDQCGRTKEEVLAVFDAAIAAAERTAA